MKINYNLIITHNSKFVILILLFIGTFNVKAQPYLLNTNSSGGIQNAGGISIYNLSSPAGTPPEFYDHGESFTGNPGDFSALFKASDGYIYGHTEGGGENYSGIFFKINPSDNKVQQLFSFDYNNHFPIYNMVEYNQILYGIMRNKHTQEDIIFGIRLNDPSHPIALTNLKNKYKIKRMGGGFYVLNDRLYATVFDGYAGSPVQSGGILEYDPSIADTRILCRNPYGLILASGNLSHRNVNGSDRLIVANSASQYGVGGFYEVDVISGVIREINVVRDKTLLGQKFSGVFRNTSGTFYSRSFEGGAVGLGTLVSVDPDDKSVTKEFTLSTSNGYAISALAPHGHNLIGMTQPASSDNTNKNQGVIYQIDKHGSYTELYHFKDFFYPSEYFIVTDDDGGTVWGMTAFGGDSNQGTIFKYQLATNKMEVIASFGSDTGFIPETRLISYKNGTYTFSNRDGGINNKGTLATFDPSSGSIGHLYSTGNNTLAHQGYSNGAFLASNGKYYSIERTTATAYNILKDSLFYRDRLIEFNDELDSVIVLSGRMKNRLYEANEKAPYNVIGEIIELQGKLVFTYSNILYTYDLATSQFTELVDLRDKRNVDNNDNAWDWGYLFSSAVTKKDDNTYYYSTQGSGENILATHGGTILKLDVSSSLWVLTLEYTIDVLTNDSNERTKIELRSSSKGGPGVKGRMLILPGAGGDIDTLVIASEYNSPTTMGCILAYPMGENTNRIGTMHIIKEFPETGFDTNTNSSANDSTDGWFPMADLAYHDNKIYGFTKGGEVGNYNSNTDRGKESGTSAFKGTFWSIDRSNSNTFELLYTLDNPTGTSPLQTNVDIIQLVPITGQKINADTLGCAISTRTFKVFGHNRGDLEWWSSTSEVKLVPASTNADSATFDFSGLTSGIEQTTSIYVASYNSNAVSGYQYGDTLTWNIHQNIPPTIGDIVSSVDLHCLTNHARLTLSSFSHVDSFYWELPTDIIPLTSIYKEKEIQVDLSRESYGVHKIICHAFNACGQEVSDTLTFELFDPNYNIQLTGSQNSICTDETVTYTVSTPVSGQSINWHLPLGAYIVNQDSINSSAVEVDFSSISQGTYEVVAAIQASCNIILSDTLSVEVHSAPVINSISANRELSCDDEIISFMTNANGANSYQWLFPSEAMLISGQNTNLLTLDMSDITSNTVYIGVVIQNSCNVNLSDSLLVSVPNLPTVGGIDISNDIIHTEDTVTMTASNVDGATSYKWTLPKEAVVIGENNEISISFTVRETKLGDHNVAVQAENQCGASINTTAKIRIESPTSLEDTLESNIILYPNPSKSRLSFQGIFESTINVVIRDINGRVVKKYKGKPSDIKLNKMTSGKYFVDVYSDQHNYGIHPIIIKK